MKVLVVIGLVAGLLLLNVVLLRKNRSTPVPEGCENLKPDCHACGIKDCSMRSTFKGDNTDGNH
ncbi:MAG: hypothetical protein ACI32N_00285 [Bulleidia sp.]